MIQDYENKIRYCIKEKGQEGHLAYFEELRVAEFFAEYLARECPGTEFLILYTPWGGDWCPGGGYSETYVFKDGKMSRWTIS